MKIIRFPLGQENKNPSVSNLPNEISPLLTQYRDGARGQLLVSTKYAWSVLTVPMHGLVESVAKVGPPPPAPKPLAGLRGSR